MITGIPVLWLLPLFRRSQKHNFIVRLRCCLGRIRRYLGHTTRVESSSVQIVFTEKSDL